MIAKRLRDTPELEVETGPSIQDESILRLSKEQAEKIRALETQVLELDLGGASLTQAMDKSKALEEKVKYLEQKLLEYEILQEEISTLSVLKNDNEKLKSQILQLGGAPASPKREAPAPAPAAAAAKSPLSVSIDLPTSGLKPFDDEPEAKSASGTLAQDEIDGLIAKIDSLSAKR